jgi:hypothetical protein
MTFSPSCVKKNKPEIQAGIDACDHCKMVIEQLNQASAYIYQSEFRTFCSPACLLTDYETVRSQMTFEEQQIYFSDYDSKALTPADSIFFLLTKSLPTVMNSGVLCFRSINRADSFIRSGEETVTHWLGYQIRCGTPDKSFNLTFSENRLSPEVIVLDKNELAEIIIHVKEQLSNGEDDFFIKGYEEIGKIRIDPEEPTIFRILAHRPGAGFPIISSKNQKILGMIKVRGAHTADEELM